MKVEIVSTQTIRPAAAGASSPEKNLKCFTLSLFDQVAAAMYIHMILFYNSATGDDQMSEKSERLKKSLSETLTHFFPLAGRVRDNMCIADEDPGIEYTEARVRSGEILRDILSPPNMEAVGQLLPAVNPNLSTENLLLVRQTVFECGGMAIGISISHKVVDATTIYSFLRSWSAFARGSSSEAAAAAPYLNLASRFPPSDALATSAFPAFPEPNQFRSTRFVMSGSQVASLKVKSRSQSVPHPTRVEAVVSLIWQCVMRSESKINPSSSFSRSGIWQFVNLRNRINPPLAESTFGNLGGFYKTTNAPELDVQDIASLVTTLRHAKEEYMRVYVAKTLDRVNVDDDGWMGAVFEPLTQLATDLECNNNNAATTYFSSLCKLDMYGAGDFGWGRPIWVTFYRFMDYTKFVLLSDTDDDDDIGIQVWLSLPKHQMELFEKDPLLLSFATPNPSILFHQYQTTRPRL